ncbi:unnamed protein product, partial [Vitis vinifera]
MAIPIKASLLALILLLTPLSSGMAEGFKDGTSPIYLLHKDGTLVNSKKLLKLDAVLDYDYAEANPKHDPRRGKPVIIKESLQVLVKTLSNIYFFFFFVRTCFQALGCAFKPFQNNSPTAS